ncbi:MAG: HPr(Ser) kinase/phosphatase [Verrucomicrobiota bacterium]|nr:HPr(Ser) kinase/phosphatase [Verrucomicrobiota bacterium]
MKRITSISVGRFYERHHEALKLRLVGDSQDGFERTIREPAPNRPGLALAGFFTYFANKRIQIIGNSEASYLKKLSPSLRAQRFRQVCEKKIPCVVTSRDHILPDELLAIASEYKLTIFRTPMVTMQFLNLASILLEQEFSESTTVHGCMVDFRGVGILIIGSSGSGKSETAIGLLERGGALVADDMVRIKRHGDELIASCPDLARGYIEMRGIGIINAANLYGLSSIRPEKRLDLVVTLKDERDLNNVDRLGLHREGHVILDHSIPHVEIPVAAGRDTARLVTVAALDLQLRRLGYDMADEFNQKLLAKMQSNDPAI